MNLTSSLRIPTNKKMFIPFIVAGDPTPEVTIDLALALQEAGASVLELGIPYSDPLADGPIIQKASSRALSNGMTLERAIELVSIMRKKGLKIPVVVFTYYNPVLQLGEENFFRLAKKNGVDGLLIPDLPYEESEQLRRKCREEGIQYISLVAPTSENRIQKIANDAEGFLYCVSSLGVTGVRNELNDDVYNFLHEVKKKAHVPIVVGFGISKSDHVEVLVEHCDGVVIGSALIQQIEKLGPTLVNEQTKDEALLQFKGFIRSIISPLYS